VVISNPVVTLLGSSSQGKNADCPMRAFMSLCCSPLNVEFDSTAAVPVIKKKTNIVVVIHLQPKVVDAEVVET
jgi:hypothetical protein